MVSYDIGSSKKRIKLAKFLEVHGRRLQKSVFMIDITKHEIAKFKKDIQNLVGTVDTQVLFIPLCITCQNKIQTLGETNEQCRIY